MKTLQKELTKRFTDAVTKLYTAFHNNELNKMYCEQCAVGSIVGSSSWADLLPKYGSLNIARCDDTFYKKHEPNRIINSIQSVKKTGYSINELEKVENVFMYSHNSCQGKDGQFIGLCAVIEYLCKLDNIPNILDYTSLFEFNKDNEPKKELVF